MFSPIGRQLNPVRTVAALLAILAVSLLATTQAHADSELTINYHNVAVQAYTGLNDSVLGFGGVNHTGILQFTANPAPYVGTAFTSIALNDQFLHMGDHAFFSQFNPTVDGYIRLNNGTVTEGQLTLGLHHTDPFNVPQYDSLTYHITPGATLAYTSLFFGSWYSLDLTTFGNVFSSATFATIDVSPWFNAQGQGGLAGSMIMLEFSPNAAGYAGDVDLMTRVTVVPTPSAAIGALLLLVAMATMHIFRRRLRRA